MALQTLPLPILLLIHLHILAYPHANAPEYTAQVFDAHARGLRDRVRTMQDVAFFLVGRVDPGKAKTILPTYPCTQPTDTTTFRASLSKYLDALRHGVLKAKSDTASTDTVASWWANVLVRKSDVEECAGERFERILVSLSTHALLVQAQSSVPRAINLDTNTAHTYYATLAASQTARRTWERAAAQLVHREAEMAALKAHLAQQGSTDISPYASLPTERLVALAASRLDDLTRRSWSGAVLSLLKSMAGLDTEDDLRTALAEDGDSKTQVSTMPIEPLPVAAAYHPSRVAKLRAPLFSASSKHAPPTSIVAAPEPGAVSTDARVHDALSKALSRTRMLKETLSKRVEARTGTARSSSMRLWEPARDVHINFTTKPTQDLLTTLGLSTASMDTEARIAQIRGTMLPAYPDAPSTLPPSSSDPSSSKIPRRAEQEPPSTPEHQRMRTSTPPASLKPRSAYARRLLGGVTGHAHVVGGRKSGIAKRRMSRMSNAVRRPSMFPAPRAPEDDEVDRIVGNVQDASESDEGSDVILDVTVRSPYKAKTQTPGKGARTPGRKTRTPGVLLSTIKRSAPRASFKMRERASLAPLPAMRAQDDWSDEEEAEPSPHPGATELEVQHEEDVYEGQSMTLRDILLSAGDTTEFDLLGGDNGVDDMVGDDESFAWE